MKKIDLQKSTEALKKAASKAGEAEKSAAEAAKNGAQALSVKAQLYNTEAQIKKYNPLFPEQYMSENFNLPNLIMIVADAVRKEISVCNGAIGWLSNEKGVEMLHLYDEAVAFSGLHFFPAATCDSIYYIDPHKRKNFISIDCYFSNMQESKLAELQKIAYALGAKRYWVEMLETTKENNSAKASASLKVPRANASAARSYEEMAEAHSKSLAEASFTGDRQAGRPELCWFAHDNNVKNLIEMCCSEKDKPSITSYNIELSNSNAATMSTSTAMKIDATIKKLGLNSNLNAQSAKEYSRKLLFRLEF